MSAINFSKSTIERLPPCDGNTGAANTEYSDSKCTGLRLQVGKTGNKYFYYRYSYNGSKQAIRLGQFGVMSVEEARAAVAEAKRKMLVDGFNPKSKLTKIASIPTVQEFSINSYLPHAQVHKRSWKNDAAKLRDHINPAIGSVRLDQLTVLDIENLINGLRSTLTNATCNRVFATTSVMLNCAVRWQVITNNPCQHVKKLKEREFKGTYFNADQVRRILSAANANSNFYAGQAIRTLLLTGLRRNEALRAKREHLDRESRTLYIEHTKSGLARTVVLNDAAFEILNNLPPVDDSPWLFPGRDPSKPLHNIMKAWHRALKCAGVERARIHDTRHSFAALAINSGVDLYSVQNLLGHKSNSMVTQRYARLSSTTLRNASQAVSNLVKEA